MKKAWIVLWLMVIVGAGLNPAPTWGLNVSYDVFASANAVKGRAGLFFVDARTGLSSVVVTDGMQHTLLQRGVLYREPDTGVMKVAYPDGRIELHPAIQPTSAKAALNWITSPDRTRIAWTVSQVQGTTLVSDLFIAQADGSDKKLALHTSSTRNIDTVPLALTNDGATVFYARQAQPAASSYQLFDVATDVFQLDVASGKATQLPAESKCACAVGFSPDGRIFVRLEADTDKQGFGARAWDLSIKINTAVKAPNIIHTQAGNVLVSRDGTLALYTSARGVPPAKGVPPERYVIVLADFSRREQRVLTEPQVNNLRAVTFEADKSSALVVGVDKDGTYKLSLRDGSLLPVSAYTYLGTITE
ncbi:MAG: hypothetical protein IT324_26895 [Anaerolineae bacterium]|nr:hypothetical protein [Anaerolineae bacterium]